MCIYRGRHKAYEPFVVIMVLVMIFFPIIGIPVFVFRYSEYMKKVLLNWLMSLSALKDDRLRMYKVYWNNGGSANLAIRQNDLVVSEQKRNQYENETRHLVRLEDMENGKVVNAKLISRIMREQEERLHGNNV